MTEVKMNNLKPCPFCGKILQRDGALWAHGKAESGYCVLSAFAITEDRQMVDAWNRREGRQQ